MNHARKLLILGGARKLTMPQVIARLGLSANLKLCLDLGDPASYPGSGQTVFDLSGGGSDFFLGTNGSVAANDPTPNDGPPKHLAFDGGDWLTRAASNDAWIQNLHKDNAAFTLLQWVYIGAIGTSQGLFGNNAFSATNIGLAWIITNTGVHNLFVTAGGGTTSLNQSSAMTAPAGSWLCVGISVNEATGAGGITYFQNGSTETDTSTYTTPSASDATFTAQIGTRGNNSAPLSNGSRLSKALALDTAMTVQQMQDFFAMTRGVYGV